MSGVEPIFKASRTVDDVMAERKCGFRDAVEILCKERGISLSEHSPVTLTPDEIRNAYEEIRATFTRMDMAREAGKTKRWRHESDVRLIVAWWRELRLWYAR